MTALRNLPPGRRAAFILLHVMGLSPERVAEVCKSNVSALRVLEGRARKVLDGYLTTRCEHLDPGNPCHCAPRLGGALERGFVTWPTHNDFLDAGPPGLFSQTVAGRWVIYGALSLASQASTSTRSAARRGPLSA